MSDLLTEADLAYMRETQAEARPTEASLARRATARAADGGVAATWLDPEPVAVRVNSAPDRIPADLAARYERAALAQVTVDLVPIRAGDRITVGPTEVYEVVTEGDQDAWTTAQQVWAHRVTYPAGP